MADWTESGNPRVARPTAANSILPTSFDWSALIGCDAAAGCLEQLARWLGPGTLELTLNSSEREPVAVWRAAEEQQSAGRVWVVRVNGPTEWRLSLRAVEPGPAGERLAWAGQVLEAWRESRLERTRAESGLARRTRELDLIQLVGRGAAEARTPDELFTRTIVVLEQGDDFDVALIGHGLNGHPELAAFLGRPMERSGLQTLGRSAAGLLGWKADALPEVHTVRLETFDPQRSSRAEVSEEELVVLPILRRNQPVACIAIVPSTRTDELRLRLLYSAANQLALHLDRILTVRESEAGRFRSILNSMPQSVLVVDHELRVIQSNRSAERTLGALEPILEHPDVRAAVDAVRFAERPFAEDEIALDGARRFGITVSPLSGERGSTDDLVLVFTDVTEKRRLQLQLAQSEKMSSLGQMISGVAHELNNPLTSILGYAQLVGVKAQDAAEQARVELLQSEAQRCQKIVRNLLSFARRREPEWKLLSVNEVVRSVLALLAYQLRVDGIDVTSELSNELPAVRGDTHQLQQVLVNLITNAQQAIRQDAGTGSISLTTLVAAGGGVVFEIGDSGPGIDETIRSRIFDPFFTTKPEGQGTGLGLSLVYGIVAAHGGSIEAVAPGDRGALFRLSFPVTADEIEPDVGPEPSLQLSRAATARILVVDDEPPLARMICEMLDADGHQATEVHDGVEALRILRSAEFDLIISDLRMPGMDGEQLHDEIRRLKPELSGRLLLTTGDTMGTDSDRVAQRTGLEILHKPFDLERLRSEIRRCLSGGGD